MKGYFIGALAAALLGAACLFYCFTAEGAAGIILFGAGLLLGGAAALFGAGIARRREAADIAGLAEDAAAAAAGDYTRRFRTRTGILHPLCSGLNAMAESLQDTREELRQQRAQMRGVLEGMDDGVVAVDADGRTLLYNDRAVQLLGCTLADGQILSGDAAAGLRSRLLAAMQAGKPGRETLALPDGRMLEVYIAPLRPMSGALAVMADVTKLRKLETMRSQFVANVTHELKTPLTSIMGYIELLKGEPRQEEVRQDFYEIMQIEAERLQHLIDDLLLLGEIENSKELHLQTCDLSAVLQETARSLRPLAQKQQVTLHTDAEPGLSITANPLRLRQLFTNLLDNALKYNRPGGSVEASARREGDALIIRVADTGIGIDPIHFERLFERFYRVDKGRSREMGGTGLGLSIVKHIVQLYGGEIRVESQPGEGSVFTVRLPGPEPAAEAKA